MFFLKKKILGQGLSKNMKSFNFKNIFNLKLYIRGSF